MSGFQDDRCQMEALLGLMGDCQGGLFAPVGGSSGYLHQNASISVQELSNAKFQADAFSRLRWYASQTNRLTNSKVNISFHYLWRDNNKCQLTLAILVYTHVTEKQNYYSTGETLHGIQYTGCSKKPHKFNAP